MDGTAARFAEVGRRIDDLRGEIGTVATVVRDLAQIVARHDGEITEHQRRLEEDREYIRQIFARMEQHDARMAEHDARFEAMTRDIRRMLDAIERRGGNGGRRRN
jgi:chromosome segregation ATPase